jgi:hypothetical protein
LSLTQARSEALALFGQKGAFCKGFNFIWKQGRYLFRKKDIEFLITFDGDGI